MIRRHLFIVIIIPIVIFLLIFLKLRNNSEQVPNDHYYESEQFTDELINEENLIKEEQDKLIVDIKGAIKHPGVYEFNEGDRVNDLIKQAGGFLEEADETKVNLAQKLHDEMILFIPEEGEENIEASNISLTSTSNGSEADNIVQVNYATKEQFETLPGIGPSKAQAIIDYREEHGPFNSPDDLLNISGIGEKTLENIEQYIQVP